MNKFTQMLNASNAAIKAARAKIVNEEATDAIREIVREKRQKKRDIEKKLLSLTDLHQDSELSLRVVKNDFDAKKWLNEIHALRLDELEATIELQAAEEMEKEWFGEEEASSSAAKAE